MKAEDNMLRRNLEKLKSFALCQENWNGYGAPKFDSSLLRLTEQILKALPHQPEVFPIAGGAIQLEYETESGAYLELEILEKENANCLIVDKDGTEQEFTVAYDQIGSVVSAFLQSIRRSVTSEKHLKMEG